MELGVPVPVLPAASETTDAVLDGAVKAAEELSFIYFISYSPL